MRPYSLPLTLYVGVWGGTATVLSWVTGRHGSDLLVAIIVGLVSAGVYAGGAAGTSRRTRARLAQELSPLGSGLSVAERFDAEQASLRGRVPHDARVRAIAAEMAEVRLAAWRRTVLGSSLLYGGFCVLVAIPALTISAAWWVQLVLTGVGWFCLFGQGWMLSRQVHRLGAVERSDRLTR